MCLNCVCLCVYHSLTLSHTLPHSLMHTHTRTHTLSRVCDKRCSLLLMTHLTHLAHLPLLHLWRPCRSTQHCAVRTCQRAGISLDIRMLPWVERSKRNTRCSNRCCETPCLSFPVSLCLCLSLSLSVSLCLCLSLSLSVSLWLPPLSLACLPLQLASCGFGGDGDALLANVEGSGYFRVNYTHSNWQLLTTAVRTSTALTDLDTTTLINDAFALNFFNLIDFVRACVHACMHACVCVCGL